jgi:hypothetical protein
MKFLDMSSEVSYFFHLLNLEMKTYIINRISNRTKRTSRRTFDVLHFDSTYINKADPDYYHPVFFFLFFCPTDKE